MNPFDPAALVHGPMAGGSGCAPSWHRYTLENWTDQVLAGAKSCSPVWGYLASGSCCLAQLRGCGWHHTAASRRQPHKGLPGLQTGGEKKKQDDTPKRKKKGNEERRKRQPKEGRTCRCIPDRRPIATLWHASARANGLRARAVVSVCLSVRLWRQNTPA